MPSRLHFVLGLAALLISCGGTAEVKKTGTALRIEMPMGLPPVPVPADNPLTVEKVALGKKLYFDPRLSGDGTVSCASCHNPKLGFGDGQKTSLGVNHQAGARNAPTVMNAAFGKSQFWDGRAASLEEQAAGPIANPIEMNLPHGECTDRLAQDKEYKRLFAAAFGDGAVTMDRVQKAIASYERTIVTGNSPFDRYYYGKDKPALSEGAARGLALFLDKEKGNCAVCHLVGEESAVFTDGKFHNLGAGLSPEGELTDLGRYEVTKVEADKGAFKTPSLRNVAQTGPYMHNGSLKTLRAVVDFYAGGGSSNPYLDKDIRPLSLTGKERADLVEFLESLTGELPDQKE